MLIALAGLPGAGKSSIARELARRIGAVWVRIDSIEQAIAGGGPVEDRGYRAAYAIARDNLRVGRVVIADSVNPLAITRDAWAAVAREAGARLVEVEVVCSDAAEHRRRVELRTTDIEGLRLPTWAEVEGREYEGWGRIRLVVDTAGKSLEACVREIEARLREESGA